MATIVILRMECFLIPEFACRNGANEKSTSSAVQGRDAFWLNRHRALSFCLSMISAQMLRICREGKPVTTFPDHALIVAT
jgi:hypothetical protein